MQTPLDKIADASNVVVLDAARAGDTTASNEIVAVTKALSVPQ